MNGRLRAPLLALLVLVITASVPGQTAAPPASASQPSAPPPGSRELTGEDEKRAKQLDEQINKAMEEDRWGEAIAKAQELVASRARVQGPKHFETVDAEWRLKALRRVAPMSEADRVAYRSAKTMNEQAEKLNAQGKYAQAQPFLEKALEIRRRLLTDDHPGTAVGYGNLATNLHEQGKYAQAQPLFEKALEIFRRLLTDDHPYTAVSYHSVASNLDAQGKHAQAQPLCEKALEIDHRLLTDDHAN
jgi:tetratricopeptide (TPR) repeat protein